MGLFDFLRGKAPPPAAPAAAPAEEQGIPGNANFGGRLVTEPNALLRDQAGYGRAGSYEFGEWDEIVRSNPFVSAGLDFVLGPIRDARLDVEEPSADAVPDEALRRAVTDFVRWNLTEKLPLASVAAAAAHGFLGSGFSLFEPVYGLTPHPLLPGGQGFYLRRMAERLPNSLHPNPWLEDDSGTLRAIRQHGPRGMSGRWLDVELPIEKLVLFSWQRSGGNWQGKSAFRAVWYIAGRVMPELLRLVGVTLQREGAGIPVVEAADKSTPLTPEQRTQLVELMSGLVYHESASAVLPPGWTMNWVFSGGGDKGHVLEVWRQLGIVVLQQVGAQQLALGTSDTGSRSVGETHDARAMAYVRGVVAYFEAVINGVDGVTPSLVRRIVEPNWGPLAAYPKVKLTLKRPELDPKTRLEAMSVAKGAGLLTVTAADENHVREELGLAPIDDDERDAARAEAAARAPVIEAEPQATATLRASAQRGPWAPWRALRASEARLQPEAVDAYLTQRREDFEALVRPIVVAMLAKAAPDIREAMKDGNPSEVATLPLDTAALDEAIRGFLDDTAASGAGFVREELRRPLTAAAGDGGTGKRKSVQEVLKAQGDALRRRMETRLRAELEREAIDVIQRGGDVGDVVRRAVSRQLDTGAFRSDAGSVSTRAFGVGREEAARILGGVAKVERTAILDSGTCDVCRAKDGLQADFESTEHDALMTPERDCAGGDNCRCLLLYLPASRADDEEAPPVEVARPPPPPPAQEEVERLAPTAAQAFGSKLRVDAMASDGHQAVARALEALPKAALEKVAAAGVQVSAGPGSIVEVSKAHGHGAFAGKVGQDPTDTRTWADVGGVYSHTRKVMMMGDVNGRDARTIEHVTRHEFGHALDYNLSPQPAFAWALPERLSDDAGFARAHAAWAGGLARWERGFNTYFTSPAGRVETFAEAFALLHGPGGEGAVDTRFSRNVRLALEAVLRKAGVR